MYEVQRKVPVQQLVITLDGPAGVGKSTASKLLAARLAYRYLDTGALYRTVAWKVQKEQLDTDNSEAIQRFLSHTTIRLSKGDGEFSIQLDRQRIDKKVLRTSTISHLASTLATLPFVREWLLPVQREAAVGGGVIAEGRDMGTRVFPDADLKFFLNADLEVRANRRQRELAQEGETLALEVVRNAMVARDDRDQTREIAPLRPASQAMMIDTSRYSVEEVVDHMMEIIADRL